MSKPEKSIKQLVDQQAALTNKAAYLEERINGITQEFTDIIDTLSQWLNHYHAGDHNTVEQANLAIQTESILRKMRKKYG